MNYRLREYERSRLIESYDLNYHLGSAVQCILDSVSVESHLKSSHCIEMAIEHLQRELQNKKHLSGRAEEQSNLCVDGLKKLLCVDELKKLAEYEGSI